ncbi:MAG TPA: hypothetical protein VFR67_26935 [Pilimelia sp.]|nr:hypothetical protein [Pilimelia sp.]
MADLSGDLDMTRQVTANLWFWQGLRWAPVGPLAAAATILASAGSGVVLWAGYAAMLALAWLLYRSADRYYVRRYGVVRLALSQHRHRDRIKWLAVYPAMLAAIVVDMLAKPAVFLTGLVWAVAILLYRRATGGGRRHYIAAAAVLAAFAPLPALGVVDAGAPVMTLWLVVMAVLYLVCGLLDHVELARRFPPVAEVEPAGAPR